MTCTVEEFRVRLPEFSDPVEYTDLRIQLFLDDAANIYMGTDENRWCNKYNYAQCYLGAHLLNVGTASEAGDSSVRTGPIASKSAGGVSVSRAVIAKDRSDLDDFYMGTSYGLIFLNVRNTCFAGIMVANRL